MAYYIYIHSVNYVSKYTYTYIYTKHMYIYVYIYIYGWTKSCMTLRTLNYMGIMVYSL